MADSRVVVFRPGALGDTIVAADALAAVRAHFPRSIVELVGNAPAGTLLQIAGLVEAATAFDSRDVAALFEAEPRVAERWRNAELVVLWLPNAEAIAEAFRAAGAGAVVACDPRPFALDGGKRPHPTRAFGASPASPRGRGEDTHPARAVGASPGAPRGRGDNVHQTRAFGASPASPTGGGGTIRHISDYLVGTLRPIGIARVDAAPALLKPPPAIEGVQGSVSALLHPGSGSPRKNWPADHFAELARRLLDAGWAVRLARGPADREAVDATRGLVGAGQLTIEEPADPVALASLLAAANLYVGNDSGVSHLAARLGVPTVAIFSATDPRVWAPRGPRVVVVDGDGSWPAVDQVWEVALQVAGRELENNWRRRRLRSTAGGPLQDERSGEENEEREDRDSVDQSCTLSLSEGNCHSR